MKPRVRFAPSPTGHLHVGSVRVAIFNWLFARHEGGTYTVRMENTDVRRCKQEYVDAQLRSLAWLELLPDEPIVYQLDRAEQHRKVARELIKQKRAYPCFCEPKDTSGTEEKIEGSLKYDGTCRDRAFTQEDLTKPHAIRFRMDFHGDPIEFDDAIRGRIVVERNQLDDFIIMRRDGTPVYNFVVVLDDIFMGITHVIRGEDHISNTPKQLLIYKTLEKQPPRYAHLPLILGKSGQRLSKREAATSVEEYRNQGFLADVLFNYLVRLGWSHGNQEIFSKEELVRLFTLEAIGKKGAIFDIKKLTWLNGVYLRQATGDELLKALDDIAGDWRKRLADAWSAEKIPKLIEVYKDRAMTLVDLAENSIALAFAPKEFDLSLLAKWRTPKTSTLLQEYASSIPSLKAFEAKALLDAAQQICDSHEEKLVNLAQALRLALTGKVVTPDIFEMLALVGKEESIQRIVALVSFFEKSKMD